MRRVAPLLVLPALVPAFLGACQVTRLVEPAPVASHHETRRAAYADGTPRSEEVVRVFDDGRVVRDGWQRQWYPDGKPEFTRFWRAGEPAGTWKSWYANGQARSTVAMGRPGEPGEMSFYFEDGTPSGQGRGVGGVREGPWTYWHPNGAIAERGAFVGGLRDGWWEVFDEDGTLAERRLYRAGERVETRWADAPRDQ